MERLKEKYVDSLSYFYVATEDDFAGASIMSALEEFDFKVPVVAPIKWLKIQLIGNDFEPYRRRHIHFVGIHHVAVNEEKVEAFRNKILDKWNAKPVKFEYYSTIGYETMHFFGRSLFDYGNVLYQSLNAQGYVSGVLSKGVNIVSQSNTVVPIYKLDENYNLVWVNKELTQNVNSEK